MAKKEIFFIYSGLVQTSDGQIMKDEHQAGQMLLQQAKENGYKDLLDELGINNWVVDIRAIAGS